MIKKIRTGKHAGEYQVLIQPINKVTGKRENWPVEYAKTNRAAKSLERKMWADFEAGYNFGDSNAVFVDELKKYVASRKKMLSAATQKDWDYTASICEQYFNKAKIRDINQRVMNEFAHDFVKKHNATVSKTTVIARRLTHIRKFFKTLEGNVVKENPVPERFLQCFFQKQDFSVGRKIYIFSNDDLNRLKREIQVELKKTTVNNWGTKLAIWIDLETGMRPGELQALRFQNFVQKDAFHTFKINDSWSDSAKEFNGALKSRPKGYYRYCLPISNELSDVFKEYSLKQANFLRYHGIKNIQKLVFINLHDYKSAHSSEPITQRSMNQMLKKLCKKIGINPGSEQLSMYSFRHTVCTKLANKPGISYPWAAERMGHSLPMFMKTYVKVDADVDKQMMEKWLK
ncbi:site-specific integrase [Lactobacillus reuteri]|uniref:tyrosine-type recombinase/integrase n=1 Tax=Limosilactobacillus reuteri TaxID=1598 RepID=UPI00128BAF6F|nr:site-specific integrase [Limosilactobacillus reuteri]MQB94031.1 site-specific integrase [Limosilactobacillus reuteri]